MPNRRGSSTYTVRTKAGVVADTQTWKRAHGQDTQRIGRTEAIAKSHKAKAAKRVALAAKSEQGPGRKVTKKGGRRPAPSRGAYRR